MPVVSGLAARRSGHVQAGILASSRNGAEKEAVVCRRGSPSALFANGSGQGRSDLDGAEALALRRLQRVAVAVALPLDPDDTVLEIHVAEPQTECLRDPRSRSDEEPREEDIVRRARLEVLRDLV